MSEHRHTKIAREALRRAIKQRDKAHAALLEAQKRFDTAEEAVRQARYELSLQEQLDGRDAPV